MGKLKQNEKLFQRADNREKKGDARVASLASRLEWQNSEDQGALVFGKVTTIAHPCPGGDVAPVPKDSAIPAALQTLASCPKV